MKKDFISDITAFVTEKAGKVSEKADKVIVVQGLHGQIRSAGREINRQYIELGKLVYEKYLGGEDIMSEALPHCEKIGKLYDSIETYRDTIEEYKKRQDTFEDEYWDFDDEDLEFGNDAEACQTGEARKEEKTSDAGEKVETSEVIDEVIPPEDVEIEEKDAFKAE